MCSRDCRMPIAITRSDGSIAQGTFSSPVVTASGCPALLGLRSLQENRAILDLGKNMLHFVGPGEATLVLPPGSESYQLQAARSGHLLLPCDAFSALPSHNTGGEHHLFADNAREQPAGEAPDASATPRDAVPFEQVYHQPRLDPQQLSQDENECAKVMSEFSWESAARCVCEVAARMQRDADVPQGRFVEDQGISLSLGAYVHGGKVGVTRATKARPQLTRLLCRMLLDRAPDVSFTSLQLLANVSSPVHTDRYNDGLNFLLPVKLPPHGGNVWLELCEGDHIRGPVHIREHDGQTTAGQHLQLREGVVEALNPRRKHATQPWARGTRLVIAAFTSGSQQKLSSEDRDLLASHGLPGARQIPWVQQSHPVSAQPTSESSSTLPVAAQSTSESSGTLPVAAQSTSESSGTRPAAQPTPRSSRVPAAAKAKARVGNSMVSIVKRVLLVTLYHSTMTAFLEQGWEAMRVRPLELLRDNFGDVLRRLKESEYHAMWIDLAEPRQFAGNNRMGQVCARLTVLMQWAERKDVPVVFSSCRRVAWQHVAVEEMLNNRRYHVSYQNWCAHGVKVAPTVEVSAVKHKMLSSLPLPSTECNCPRGLEHTHDLDINRGPGTSRVRAEAEHRVISHVVATLSALVEAESSGSAKTPDPLCTVADSSQSEMTFACECCGLIQTTEFCPVCDAQSVPPPRREYPVLSDRDTASSQLLPVAEPGSLSTHQANIADADQAYPTEQKLRAQARRKQGLPQQARKKPKVVQQHFDDCGDSLASLDMTSLKPSKPSYISVCFSDEDDDDALCDLALAYLVPQVNSLETHPPGAERASFQQAAEAVDVDELLSILAEQCYAAWGPEIVELCGGNANSSKACVRRRLQAGQNFDIECGIDLTHGPTQSKVLKYIAQARPLVVVMSPVCMPYGPLGTQNRTMYPSTWAQSDAMYAPLASFCGQVAELQHSQRRYFLCEQPFPSTLFDIEPWPRVRAQPECCRVVLHQCQLGLIIDGLPAKKPTELTANAVQLLAPFANLQCPGTHVHVHLQGRLASQAQVWPPEMCRRVAAGIESLARHLSRADPWRLDASLGKASGSLRSSFPSVGTDPEPEIGPLAEEPTSEPWRKCKGCLWRAEKHDPMHNRVRGECKHPDVEPMIFECPSCKTRKHRSDPGHTFGPDCRHALTQERKSSRRRPYARRPATQEPTADLHPNSLNQGAMLDEEAAAPQGPAAGAMPAGNSEPSSGSREPARRGPDQGPRHMRASQESSAQTSMPADWGSFDVQASFRSLRSADEATSRRILRKLHLRWFHIGSDKMQRLLKCAGFGKEVLDLIPAIVDTCRVCQHWSRPGTESKTSGRLVLGFNLEVEGDLMFCRINGSQRIILVLVDRGVRWTSTRVVENKSTPTLLDAIDQSWVAVFGPMSVLVFDGETGLDDDESTIFFQLRGITKRTAAPRQHTRIADRKIAVLRDTIHKLNTQLVNDGVNLPFVRIVAEATFAVNALTSVNGLSPYTAVLGRVPAILPCDDTLLSDDTPSGPSRHSFRLRELAVQAIAEGTARERTRRAMSSQAKPAFADLDYRIGETVDYWRDPVHKDVSGWRGPATITDLTRLEHGRVGIRTSTDQVLTCRIQDIRRSLAYLSDSLQSFFRYPDHLAAPGPSSNMAQQHVQAFVASMQPGTVLTLGFVKTAGGQWVMTPQTVKHRSVYEAAVFIAETVFQLSQVACIRLARAIRTLTSRDEFCNSMLLWWTAQGSRQISFLHRGTLQACHAHCRRHRMA